MLRFMSIAVLIGASLADQSAYSGYDQQAYARDGGAHTSPASGYGAPDAGYGAPDAGYGAPDAGYGPPATGYGPSYTVDAGSGFGGDFDLGSLISDVLPIALVVFAALILASLLSPLITQLMALLVGILPLALGIKVPIVNALLAPFNLVLAQFPAGSDAATGPLSVFAPRGFTARDLSDTFGFSLSDDQIDILTNFVSKAISSFTETTEV